MTLTSPTRQPHPYVLDDARLDALIASGLLSADVEPALDRWTRLASSLLDAPVSLLSMVDRDRQYFKSQVGLSPEVAEVRETPLSHSFCQHVVATQEPFVVDDARAHPLVHDNGAVDDLSVIAYAGQPVTTSDGHTLGALCVIDAVPRVWTAAELALLADLTAGLLAEIELRGSLRASLALKDEFAHQAHFDALTGLPNRRQLAGDLAAAVAGDGPCMLAMFDLDGFKAYNDTYGHPAGDALLARLGSNLAAAVTERGGCAYRIGGDEFCVLVDDDDSLAAAVDALREHGDGFAIASSHGAVRLDGEPLSYERAMQIADERLYLRKHGRSDAAKRQALDVLLTVLREREPDLDRHVREVAELARRVGEQLELDGEALEELALAAQMHDIGKVAVPDSILDKPGPLDEEEWWIMRQHTLLGERILGAAPALREVATIVRSSHERWDGAGYPDGLAGPDIPLGSRVILTCDAFNAMTTDRPYRRGRSVTQARREMAANAGSQFDPSVVRALLAALD